MVSKVIQQNNCYSIDSKVIFLSCSFGLLNVFSGNIDPNKLDELVSNNL